MMSDHRLDHLRGQHATRPYAVAAMLVLPLTDEHDDDGRDHHFIVIYDILHSALDLILSAFNVRGCALQGPVSGIFASSVVRPVGMAAVGDGSMVVVDNPHVGGSRIVRLMSDDTTMELVMQGSPLGTELVDIAVLEGCTLVVADLSKKMVHVIRLSERTLLRSLDKGFGSVRGVAAVDSTTFIVCDSSNNRVIVMDVDGTCIRCIQHTCFRYPTCVAMLDATTAVVTDFHSDSIFYLRIDKLEDFFIKQVKCSGVRGIAMLQGEGFAVTGSGCVKFYDAEGSLCREDIPVTSARRICRIHSKLVVTSDEVTKKGFRGWVIE